MLSRLVRACALSLPVLLAGCGPAERDASAPVSSAALPAPAACATPAACEERAAARLEAVRRDPAALTAMLQRFPKGGDLHNHVAGAVYAESYIAWSRDDGFRLDDTLTLVDASKCAQKTCTEVPASASDPRYNAVVRSFSMKGWEPGGESGHDHFFAAFSRFGLVSHEQKREGPMLAETMTRAAEDGAIYLEVLVTVVRPQVSDIVNAAGPLDPHDLAGFEQKLHADPRWGQLIASSRTALDDLDKSAHQALGCKTGEARAACRLTVRYLAQVGRTQQAAQIFGELLGAFEVSQADPRLAGVNLVSPEDNATALADYDLQMSMIGFLGKAFRGRSPLRVTLHAGELIPALVPAAHPEYLQSHVRNAVESARAERIGHGVDVLGETNSAGLLAEMRARGVTVEICLSSNAIILGVSGAAHPLSAYLSAGVPVVLSTDDAGVSRSSLTGEYVRAVTAQGVTYPQLKAMARRSLTAAFVPGASLWASPDAAQPVDACAGALDAPHPPATCSAFLAENLRARLQWKLEEQLAAFERTLQ